MKVKILADSTCDLPQEKIAQYDIGIIPLYTILGENSYKDGIEITPRVLFDFSEREKAAPKTSAPTVLDYSEVFEPLAGQNRDAVYIGISSEFSCSVQNAQLAAKECGGRVHVIDSRNLSSGIGLLVLKAAELAQAGESADSIVQTIESMIPRIRASFIIDTMVYLYRGGRCSALQLVGANALQIKPEIVVEDGKMHPGVKYRGSILKSAAKYAAAVLENIDAIEPDRVFITYSLSDAELIEKVAEVVRSKGHFKDVVLSDAGCVVSSHCGPNTIGVLFVAK